MFFYFFCKIDKIQKVKAAEAHCESLHLSGIGVARARMAMSKGLDESVQSLVSASEDICSEDVMNILLLTQYLDMISRVGGNSNSLLLEYSPRVVHELKDFRESKEQ